MAKKITLVGDLTCDFIFGGFSRLPEWGQEMQISKPVQRLGGNIGNMLRGAQALGTDVSVVAAVGDDEAGHGLVGQVKAMGLPTEYLRVVPGRDTSSTYAFVREDGERLMLTYSGILEEMGSLFQGEIPSVDAVFLGGWCLPPRVGTDTLLGAMGGWREKGARVALDMLWNEASWQRRDDLMRVLGETDILFLNEMEACRLFGCDDLDEAAKRIQALLCRRPADQVALVKCGGAGARLVSCGEDLQVPAWPAAQNETVGAGDMFNIGFMHAHISLGCGYEEAVRFAVIFAALCLTARKGARPLPSTDDVLSLLGGPNSAPQPAHQEVE